MGSGVIKPNISTLMGLTYDQQRPGMLKLRSDAFAMFYGAINIGAALSSFAMPWIRTNYGYSLAFLFPAGFMLIAFIIFALGKRFYAVEHVSREPKTAVERTEQWAVLRRIGGIFIIVTFFWSIFDQSTSTWTFFARDYLDLNLFGHQIQPDMVQGINPILIILFLAPVTLLWRLLASLGWTLRPTDKMLVGFVLATGTMGMMSAAGFLTTPEHKVSVLWECAAYVVITIAEICISVVGLELAFTAAPKHMKGFVTACWLFTVFLGNVLDMAIARFYSDFGPAIYFSALTLMMVVVTVAFAIVASRFNRLIEQPEIVAVIGDNVNPVE
jgi:proton-dependent oligopeptide transporter, POT family